MKLHLPDHCVKHTKFMSTKPLSWYDSMFMDINNHNVTIGTHLRSEIAAEQKLTEHNIHCCFIYEWYLNPISKISRDYTFSDFPESVHQQIVC